MALLAAVGILAAQCAFVRGAERVVLIDNQTYRLDFAKERIPRLETLNFAQKKVGRSAVPRQSLPVLHSVAALKCDGCWTPLSQAPTPHAQVPETLKEMLGDDAPDVSIEAVGFHYTKTWVHRIEMTLMLETDPSEILNEIIFCTRKAWPPPAHARLMSLGRTDSGVVLTHPIKEATAMGLNSELGPN